MTIPIVIPTVGESITNGVIAAWRKKDGERVERDDIVLDFETDKVTLEIRSPATGTIRTLAKEGDQVEIGATVGSIDENGQAPKAGAPKATGPTPQSAPRPKESPKPQAPSENPEADVRATPLARKVAEEKGVDLTKVRGTGASARVREQDVLAYAQSAPIPQAKAVVAAESNIAATAAVASALGPPRQVVRERMSQLRQRIALRLVEAQHTAAMLTTFNECDMTNVMGVRSRYKEDFEKRHGVGLGFMSFFVRAAANALQAFPMVNASIVADEKGQPSIEKHGYCDIAIAVASPKGLVVPVIRDCQSLSMAQIEAAVKDLGARARDGKITLEEMQGGTFTITNGGIFGSLMSTPILNPPQSAILGMHAIKNRAVEDPEHPGQVVIRPMMYVALSYDHRVIDGAESVRFLIKIKEVIEDPRRMLLDL